MTKPLLLLVPSLLLAQSPNVAGRWFAAADFYGTVINFSMELNQQADHLTGNFDDAKLEGNLTGNALHFVAKDDGGGTQELTATVRAGAISGTMVFVDSDDKEHPTSRPFTATLIPRAVVERRNATTSRHPRFIASSRRRTSQCLPSPPATPSTPLLSTPAALMKRVSRGY